MFLIPGVLISILTFPGVICHEIAHRFFCDICRVPVIDICYFRFGNPAGYVVHSKPSNLRSAFLIAVGPLIINSLLCAIITFPASIPIFTLNVESPGFSLGLLMWVGISIGMSSLPSNADIEGFSDYVADYKSGGILYGASIVLKYTFKLINLLRVFWIDMIYAFLISTFLPSLMLG